jgi:hypothetical protein
MYIYAHRQINLHIVPRVKPAEHHFDLHNLTHLPGQSKQKLQDIVGGAL